MGRVSIPFALHAQLVYLHSEQVSQGQHNSEPQAITHTRGKSSSDVVPRFLKAIGRRLLAH